MTRDWRVPLSIAILTVGAIPLVTLAAAQAQETVSASPRAGQGSPGAEGCEDVTGSMAAGQTGMTAVTSTLTPNIPIGSRVRISASDRDRPANSRSVEVTVTGAQLLPANICLDLSPEAFAIFDPQRAAYRDAEVEIISSGGPSRAGTGGKPSSGPAAKPSTGGPTSGDRRAAEGCEDVTGSMAAGQTGMTAVTSTLTPNIPIGSRVRISASDRDRPANSRSVEVTVTGAQLLPANICLDLSPEAFAIFDPQRAAYRDAEVEIIS